MGCAGVWFSVLAAAMGAVLVSAPSEVGEKVAPSEVGERYAPSEVGERCAPHPHISQRSLLLPSKLVGGE